MKIKTAFYQTMLRGYGVMPFKKAICHVVRGVNIPNNKFYKDLKFRGVFKVKIDDKHSFLMMHHESTIENETFWKGPFKSWETHTGWIWKQLCPISDNILDIGANTGIYSLVAKSLNPAANIIAFEPTSRTFSKLENNVRLNKFDIRLEKYAVSSKTEQQMFYDSFEENQTSASLSPDMIKNSTYHKSKVNEYLVNTITLKEYFKNNEIDAVDLIKLDIEMHEGEAIEGMGDYLYKMRPAVVIEVLSDKVADKLNQLINKDFEIFHLEGFEKAKKVESFKVVNGKWNYLFFHNELKRKMQKYTTIYG